MDRVHKLTDQIPVGIDLKDFILHFDPHCVLLVRSSVQRLSRSWNVDHEGRVLLPTVQTVDKELAITREADDIPPC